ncbi:hypothetical protein SB912_25020, partial [Pantoea sp. SIMBA_072]
RKARTQSDCPSLMALEPRPQCAGFVTIEIDALEQLDGIQKSAFGWRSEKRVKKNRTCPMGSMTSAC